MKTMKFLTYTLFVLFLSFSVSSCTGDDGPMGPAGADGTNGTDGQDGNDGNDGNANVVAYTFDLSSTGGSSWTDVAVPALTQDVLENDVILGYIYASSQWTPIPCPADGYGFDYAVDVNMIPGIYTMDYSDGAGNNIVISVGAIDKLRVVIIESTSNTGGKSTGISSKEQIMLELEENAVDINDYNDVCAYFGINAE